MRVEGSFWGMGWMVGVVGGDVGGLDHDGVAQVAQVVWQAWWGLAIRCVVPN